MGITATRTALLAHPVQITCPAQILVLDRFNGPAEILMDTMSRIVDKDVSLTHVTHPSAVMSQLDCQPYALLVISAEVTDTEPLAIMPYLKVQYPDMPVLLVGRRIHPSLRSCAEHFELHDVLTLPQRAQKMKVLASYLACKYL